MAPTESTTVGHIHSTDPTADQSTDEQFWGIPNNFPPPTVAFQELLDNNGNNGSPAKDDAVNDPLINALAVSAIPGIKGQPYLSLHVANLIKKCI